MQTHETVTSLRKLSLGSNRTFGLAFGVVFAILGLWPLFHQAVSSKWGMIAVSTAILGRRTPSPPLADAVEPRMVQAGSRLEPNRRSGVVAILFFRAVVPLGWYLRRKGEALLRLYMNSQAGTYWIEREPPSPAPDSMNKQF